MKKITILIPCYNEAAGIRQVVRAFPRENLKHLGYMVDIIVVDNNSSDNTAQVARRAGARVIFEGRQGKGYAIRTGMSHVGVDTDFVVMLDGDDTYRAQEILRMIEPLSSRFCDVVIGSRLGGKISAGGMRGFNMMGNWIFSHMVRYFYRVNVTDVLTGYFAWNRNVVDELWPQLVSDGFAIEMEMITKMARMGHDIYCVPITYSPRAGESSLHPIRDGWRILKMFTRNLAWKPAPAESEHEYGYVPPKSRGVRRYVSAFGERIGMGGDER